MMGCCLTSACSWRARQPSKEYIPFVRLLDAGTSITFRCAGRVSRPQLKRAR
jgi:hypothetical protein